MANLRANALFAAAKRIAAAITTHCTNGPQKHPRLRPRNSRNSANVDVPQFAHARAAPLDPSWRGATRLARIVARVCRPGCQAIGNTRIRILHALGKALLFQSARETPMTAALSSILPSGYEEAAADRIPGRLIQIKQLGTTKGNLPLQRSPSLNVCNIWQKQQFKVGVVRSSANAWSPPRWRGEV
jgi:hypothetical protein